MNQAYHPPTLTVDGVVFQLINNQLSVLLIQRRNPPFAGEYALPGGYNSQTETTLDALRRVILAKAGVDSKVLGLTEQLYTFDELGRDPRGRAVSVVYMILGRNITPTLSKTTELPAFFSVKKLPTLAYDHLTIINYAHERLRAKVGYTNAMFALLPRHFTLTQLQQAYEAVLGRTLDKRNFRKQVLSLGVLSDLDEMYQDGAHRPAKLYQFKDQALHPLTNNLTN